MTTVEVRTRRSTIQPWDRPVRLTALYHDHLAAGAEMDERDGWLIPRSYGDSRAEEAALREAAGAIDIGESGKLDLKSDDIDAILAAAFTGYEPVTIGTC